MNGISKACLAVTALTLLASADSSPNRLYAEFAFGIAGFDMKNMNLYYIDAYSPHYDEHIDYGPVMDAQAGVFLNRRIKLGLSYIYAKGISEGDTTLEFTDRYGQTAEWSQWYLDAFFRGIGMGVRYYPFFSSKAHGFIGAQMIMGYGAVHMGMGSRPDERVGDYGYNNFRGEGFGGAILAGIEIFPIRTVYLGINSGYRLIRTNVLMNKINGTLWLRPPSDPHDINLDFTGFMISATIGIEL